MGIAAEFYMLGPAVARQFDASLASSVNVQSKESPRSFWGRLFAGTVSKSSAAPPLWISAIEGQLQSAVWIEDVDADADNDSSFICDVDKSWDVIRQAIYILVDEQRAGKPGRMLLNDEVAGALRTGEVPALGCMNAIAHRAHEVSEIADAIRPVSKEDFVSAVGRVPADTYLRSMAQCDPEDEEFDYFWGNFESMRGFLTCAARHHRPVITLFK